MMRGGRLVRGVVLVLTVAPVAVKAQSGIPGGRLDTGRDHRARVMAEAYGGVAGFFAKWREAWNDGDADALMRMYTDDATVRLPGQLIVRGQEPVEGVVRASIGAAATISMSDVDFDSDGERSTLVARYVLRREGHMIGGIMTALLHKYRSGWRIRVQVFDAPEAGQSSDHPATTG